MKKTKSPAFQFYYKEWLTGTMHMTRMERDIYLTLLIYQYDLDGLPNDTHQLERYARVNSKPEREALKNILHKFPVADDGKLRNSVMEKIRSAQKSFAESKSQAGKNGAKNRWAKDSTAIVLPLAAPITNDSSTSTTTSTTDINTKYLKGREHFEHMKNFCSTPYSEHQSGFISMYSEKEYNGFHKFLTAMLNEFQSELEAKFDKCISIGDWKKYLKSSPYMIVRPALIKVLGAADGDRKNMAARIATYSNGAYDEKVFVR